MKNLKICSAHSYLYSRSRFNFNGIKVTKSKLSQGYALLCNNLMALGRDALALMARKSIQKDDLLAPEVVKQ